MADTGVFPSALPPLPTLTQPPTDPLSPLKQGPMNMGAGSSRPTASPAPEPVPALPLAGGRSTSVSTSSSVDNTNTSPNNQASSSRPMTRSTSSDKDPLSMQGGAGVVAGEAIDKDAEGMEVDEVEVTEDSSNVSDGDPPDFGAPNVPMRKEKSSGSGSGSAGNGTATAAGAPRRNFEELEEITFASPKSFQAMAFDIAATRGIDLQVTDDRTHKVTSAYMHITCSYRRSGCPFILKLTKAKEGGWLLKSSKATDVDPKQRSVYRCRHATGAVADTPAGNARSMMVGEDGAGSVGTTSHPGPSGTKPKAARKRVKKSPGNYVFGEDGAGEWGDYDQLEEPQVGGRKASMAKGRLAGSRIGGAKNNNGGLQYLDDMGDRALAPPFERSNALQNTVAPALRGRGGHDGDWMQNGAASTSRYSRSNSASLPPPSTFYPPGSTYTSALSGFSNTAYAPSPQSGNRLPLTPLLAPPVPANSLPQWTAFLTLLDKELTFLAPVFSSPGFSVTLPSFFSKEDSSEEMRLSLIESLSDTDCPRWPRIKLLKLVKEKGVEAWERVQEIEELGLDLMEGVTFDNEGETEAAKKRKEKQKELERREERPGPEEMRVDVKTFPGLEGKNATTALLFGTASTSAPAGVGASPPSTSSSSALTNKLAQAKGLNNSTSTSTSAAAQEIEIQAPPPSRSLAAIRAKAIAPAPVVPPPVTTTQPVPVTQPPPAQPSPATQPKGPMTASAQSKAWPQQRPHSASAFAPNDYRINSYATPTPDNDKGKGRASPNLGASQWTSQPPPPRPTVHSPLMSTTFQKPRSPHVAPSPTFAQPIRPSNSPTLPQQAQQQQQRSPSITQSSVMGSASGSPSVSPLLGSFKHSQQPQRPWQPSPPTSHSATGAAYGYLRDPQAQPSASPQLPPQQQQMYSRPTPTQPQLQPQPPRQPATFATGSSVAAAKATAGPIPVGPIAPTVKKEQP